ncbi:MAG: hypothetical protein AB7O96_19585 [Pseudobdellovibrionaceae bacterium]
MHTSIIAAGDDLGNQRFVRIFRASAPLVELKVGRIPIVDLESRCLDDLMAII